MQRLLASSPTPTTRGTTPSGSPARISRATRIIGAISSGPDGLPETADDIASWQLGRGVTEVVRGARWVVAPATPAPTLAAKPTPAKRSHEHAPTRPAKTSTKVAAPTGATTKPTQPATKKPAPSGMQLDENGMPIAR